MYSLCFEDPYTNGGHMELILVKIGQKQETITISQNSVMFLSQKRDGGWGLVKGRSEFFPNFIHFCEQRPPIVQFRKI